MRRALPLLTPSCARLRLPLDIRSRGNPPRKKLRSLVLFALLETISWVLQLVWFVFLVMIIMSWLIAFNVVNTRNEIVAGLWRFLNQVTQPILKPIRRILPPFGGMDLSPLIVFIVIFFLQRLIDNAKFGVF
jgi:YggT family protein